MKITLHIRPAIRIDIATLDLVAAMVKFFGWPERSFVHADTPTTTRSLAAFDRERGQFLLIDEGWNGYRRIHHVWLHIELRDGALIIHEDGTEEGVASRFLAAGVDRDALTLAFHAPALRDADRLAPA